MVRIGLLLEAVAITGLGLWISLTVSGSVLAAWLFLNGTGCGNGHRAAHQRDPGRSPFGAEQSHRKDWLSQHLSMVGHLVADHRCADDGAVHVADRRGCE